MLLDFERQRVTAALETWLDFHTEPDVPAFRIAQERTELTPRQIVGSVAENDRLGQQILAILEYSIRRTSLDNVVGDLERHETEPPPTAIAGDPSPADA